ncbi:cytochrome b5 [Exidia glandulosa HHB12029]|uniref:Cytochrome b5 n=1 Tax=Exidia glandulosa HHB12029 TaxID=1314781 RepID=A0A165E8R3_EXIGL|nr:cytochrome b5 [Exidia glandulosa HHB12029]
MTIINIADVAAHKTRDSAWLVLNGKVYDATKFLDEHPGGDEVILSECGKPDATEAFDDIGHSDEARALLADMLVGTVEGAAEIKQKPVPTRPAANTGPGFNAVLVPIALLGAYLAWRAYFLSP